MPNLKDLYARVQERWDPAWDRPAVQSAYLEVVLLDGRRSLRGPWHCITERPGGKPGCFLWWRGDNEDEIEVQDSYDEIKAKILGIPDTRDAAGDGAQVHVDQDYCIWMRSSSSELPRYWLYRLCCQSGLNVYLPRVDSDPGLGVPQRCPYCSRRVTVVSPVQGLRTSTATPPEYT